MRSVAYDTTEQFEHDHWWFRSRRDLVGSQVEKALVSMQQTPQAARIIDYGCGTGYNLGLLSQFGGVVGADVKVEMLGSRAKRGATPRIDLNEDNAAHFGTFNLLTALDVLEHIEDDVAGLRAMQRFVAPGGQMLLTVPAYAWLWSGEDVISEHKRRYTLATLRRVLRAAGLEVLFASYFNLSILPMMTAVVWTRRLLNGRDNTKSNVDPVPRWLNEVLYDFTAFENKRVGTQRVRLRAGTSLVARVRVG